MSVVTSATPAATSSESGPILPPPPPSKAALRAEFAALSRRQVLMGTCGWGDESIGRCGRFYPAGIRSAKDRLRHYSTHFPCVEVDTSNYAMPGAQRIREWMDQTPTTFKFHFKVFGIFTGLAVPVNAIPQDVRHLLPDRHVQSGKVRIQDASEDLKCALWSMWNHSLRPIHEAGQLGLVIFQFQIGFLPTAENKEYVRWCRSHLAAEYQMGIEFRSRAWFQSGNNDKFTDEDFIAKTVRFARSIDCVLIAEDDLAHEVSGRFVTLPAGQVPTHLPIILRTTAPHALYVRMHRRQGTQRVLADEEFSQWAARFHEARDPDLDGPIYFLIGTDWEDQPIINSNKMMKALQNHDQQQQHAHESRASSDAASAASSSPSVAAASASVAVGPPEPLAFDYPRYYKNVLAHLPDTPYFSNEVQRSLGSFFTAAAKSAVPGLTPPAPPPAPTAAAAAAAVSVPAPDSSQTRTKPSLQTAPAFVLASTLPHAASSSTSASGAAKASFISSLTAANGDSRTTPLSSTGNTADAVADTDQDDISAQVAAIERKYDSMRESVASSSAAPHASTNTSANSASSPTRKRTAAQATAATPSSVKKQRTPSKKGAADASMPSIAAFFTKKA